MVNDITLSQIKDVLRRGELSRMRACYIKHSKDWDSQRACGEYEIKILKLSEKPRNMSWTSEIYALRDTRLSEGALKYFSLREMLDDMVKEADGIIDRYRSECRKKASAVDARFDSFAGTLSNERIAEARAFIGDYEGLSADVTRFCQKATADAVKRFEARLSQNKKDNDLRAEALSLDKSFSELPPLSRDRSYFSEAEAVIGRVRSASPDALRYCVKATLQAVNKLERDIAVEKKYLELEERISGLSGSRAHTLAWCESVWSAFTLYLMDIDKCRNGQLLRELKKEADKTDIEIVCEPYAAALSPAYDFKKVLELDSALKTFREKQKLDKGIPSFDIKWKQRVELANKQAKDYGDECFAQAERLYDNEKYDRSYSLYLEADKYGNKHAAYMLGAHCYFGDGVAKDMSRAESYFKRAAGGGDARAMSFLADIGRDRGNATEHFYWRKRAAEAGCDDDRLTLAEMYYEGIGTTRDYTQARVLFEKLLKDDLFVIQANAHLGRIYEKGLGTPINEQLACEHYEKAKSLSWAKQAYEALFKKLEEERQDREITEKFAQAEAGDPQAQYFIGWCYYTGHRCDRHYGEALKWLKRAAEGGVGKAMNLLGDMYANGEGVEVDTSKAIKYYRDAVAHGE